MARSVTSTIKDAIEIDLEVGKPAAEISAAHRVSLQTVYRIRRGLQALRARNNLDPLPHTAAAGRIAAAFTDTEHSMRAEYLATGKSRPLARKYGISHDRLRYVLDRAPSVIAERAGRLAKIAAMIDPATGLDAKGRTAERLAEMFEFAARFREASKYGSLLPPPVNTEHSQTAEKDTDAKDQQSNRVQDPGPGAEG